MPELDPLHANGQNYDDPDSPDRGPELNSGLGSAMEKELPTGLGRDPADSEQMAREIFMASASQDSAPRGRDYRTGSLTAGVIALALLLGWMAGRAGWNMAVDRGQTQTPTVADPAIAAPQPTPDTSLGTPSDKQTATHAKPAPPLSISSTQSNPVVKPKVGATDLNGGLVMYERGKVIFRTPASDANSHSAENVAPIVTEVTGKSDSPGMSDRTQSPTTNGYLLTQVAPQYPEEAKQQRVQGPVMMNAFVGSDGSVRELKVISGNPQLVEAATDAVRHWRFQPRSMNGKPVEFETRIIVKFVLP